MTNTDNQIPPPPEAPKDEECCNSGCEALCVFEIYRVQKMAYEEKWGDAKPQQK